MGKPILFEVTTSAGIKRVSNDVFNGNNYWHPVVKQFGDFVIEPDSQGGYITSKFSTVNLFNLPFDPDAVFNHTDGTYPPTHKAYVCTLYHGEGTTPIFTGTAVVRGVEREEITLELHKNNTYATDALNWIPDEKGFAVTSVTDDGGQILITTTGPNDFNNDDEIIFRFLDVTTELNYTGSNIYTLTRKSATDNNQFYIGSDPADVTLGANSRGWVGKRSRQPYAHGDLTHVIAPRLSDNKYLNPGLSTSRIIRVYEDGGMINATSTARSVASVVGGKTVRGSNATKYTITGHGALSVSLRYRPGDVLIGSGFSDGQFNVGNQKVVMVVGDDIYTNLSSTTGTSSTGTVNFESYFNYSGLGAAPTSTIITLDSAPTGQVSISGRASTGTNIEDFYTNKVASTLGLTLNTQKAPNVSSAINFYQTEQINLMELGSQIAKNINYQFYDDGSVLYLIDRSNVPDGFAYLTDENGDYLTDEDGSYLVIGEFAHEFLPADIFRHSLDFQNPVSGVTTSFSVNEPFINESGVLELQSRTIEQEVLSSIFKVGNVVQIQSYLTNDTVTMYYDRLALMENMLDIENKPVSELEVYFIQSRVKPGDRIDFFDEERSMDISLMVRGIHYKWHVDRTVFVGDSTLSVRTRV